MRDERQGQITTEDKNNALYSLAVDLTSSFRLTDMIKDDDGNDIIICHRKTLVDKRGNPIIL